MGNVSKHNRLLRPTKPELGIAGLAIGIFGGEALTVAIQVALGRPDKWVMLAGGVGGAAIGSVFDAARYWRSRRKWRRHERSQVIERGLRPQ